jgi:hypothetical protein
VLIIFEENTLSVEVHAAGSSNSCVAVRNDKRLDQKLTIMKVKFSATLVLVFICLSGFIKESNNYEQIAFDFFVTDILRSDFKDITSFEFKGKTEETYSSLGKYKFCLKPEEKLGSLLADITKKAKSNPKEIKFDNITDLKILDFTKQAGDPKLFIYPSLHVADNYYVFLSFQKANEHPVRYVFELTPEGNISRSCKMD